MATAPKDIIPPVKAFPKHIMSELLFACSKANIVPVLPNPVAISSNINKILYLEPDQIVLNDLKSLFDTDMTDYGIAACPKKIINYNNHIHKFGIVNYKDIKYTNQIFYFNAGVTLLNFEYWNNNGLYDRFIEILTENKNSSKPLYYYYTQGVLNILFFNNYKQIDYKYNVTLSYINKEPFFINLV